MRRKQVRRIEVLATALMFSPFGQALIGRYAFDLTRSFVEQQQRTEAGT